MHQRDLRIVFMGTPEFAVPSLDLLDDAGYRPACVVTVPDRPTGRGRRTAQSPVKQAAGRLGIDCVLQPESVRSPEFAAAVMSLAPDVIVVVAFRILPPAVYTSARRGAFNLHGSLLPKYRGAAPIHHAVMNGETETGVTTFFLQEEVDTGGIILQRRIPIGPDETTGDVYKRMMTVSAEVVVETVRLIDRGEAVGSPQNDAEATPAPKVYADEGCIDWNRPAGRVHNFIRGFSPIPGAWAMHGDVRLRLLRSRVTGGSGTPGAILEAGQRLVVACATGAVEVTEIQQQGRRAMSADDFLRGYELKAGPSLGCKP